MPAQPVASAGPPEGAWRHSPIEASHVRLGARLVGYAGWLLPLRYGSDLAEHRAVRQAAGVFDLSHMAEIEVRGREAGRALDVALVGSISTLAVGRARYTLMCGEDGGIVDDLVAYRTADDVYLVVANAVNGVVVTTELGSRAAGLDAEVADATDAYGLVAVQGPLAGDVLQGCTPTDLSSLPSFGCLPAKLEGTGAVVARTGYTGEDGFECFLPAGTASRLFDRLVEAGAGMGVLPAGLAARDSLRLEAGLPLYGNELTRSITPYEAGLGRLVRFDKEVDFVGRGALRARTTSPLTRRLVGLAGRGRRAPRQGCEVLADERGPVIGRVTSGALSPTLGRPIAMAYVPPSEAVPGTPLVVDVRGVVEPVEVTALPFYRRSARG